MGLSFKEPKDRIILPLDVDDIDKALILAGQLAPHVGIFKIGLEFIHVAIAKLLYSPLDESERALHKLRHLAGVIRNSAFWDGKFADISNTVAGASVAVSSMGVCMFNVHASAGMDAVKAAVDAAAKSENKPKVFGVTVLTSIKEGECKSIFGAEPNDKVLQFTELLRQAGADGVICAPLEGRLIRQDPAFNGLLLACPNIRPAWVKVKADDQAASRQLTVLEAIAAGIDALVIGRPILKAPPDIGGPVGAAKKIGEEIAIALKERNAL